MNEDFSDDFLKLKKDVREIADALDQLQYSFTKKTGSSSNSVKGIVEGIINGSSVLNQDVFGDGSDGDVIISADTSLTRDMYYDDLTVNTTKTLTTNGFKVFVKGTLNTIGTGKIASNGNAGGNGATATSDPGGAGGAAGTIAYSTGTLPIPLVGKGGGAGGAATGGVNNGVVGVAGTNQAKALGNTDAVAGGRGADSNGTGGAGGAAGTKTGSILSTPRSLIAAYNLFDLSSGTITQFGVAPSGGGGGGGGYTATNSGGGAGGGGSGSSGGVVWIAARFVANITAQAIGGDGGAGGSADYVGVDGGGGGGGAGGNGGAIIFLYSKLTASSLSVAGGAGGAGGTGNVAGTAGTAGNVGVTISLQI